MQKIQKNKGYFQKKSKKMKSPNLGLQKFKKFKKNKNLKFQIQIIL